MRCAFRSVAVAAVLWAGSAAAADFNAGLLAAQAGDFELAAREWKPLADAGDLRAMVTLGQLLEAGQGVPLDLVEAARLFGVAAHAGNSSGQVRYALALQSGRGVSRDKAVAVEWLHKAAIQHNAEAIYEIGYAFYQGEGVAADKRQAMMWFLIADEYG